MTDRELLEMAAKAAGMTPPLEGMTAGEGGPMSKGGLVFAGNGECIDWNPLTDDGDALRLAVNLNLVIVVDDQLVHVEFRSVTAPFKVTEACEAHGWNRLIATRRAVVRAAAEIGKQLDR